MRVSPKENNRAQSREYLASIQSVCHSYKQKAFVWLKQCAFHVEIVTDI